MSLHTTSGALGVCMQVGLLCSPAAFESFDWSQLSVIYDDAQSVGLLQDHVNCWLPSCLI